MKKLLTILAVLLLVGCEKDESKPCTFFVKDNSGIDMYRIVIYFGNGEHSELDASNVKYYGEDVIVKDDSIHISFEWRPIDGRYIATGYEGLINCNDTIVCGENGMLTIIR